MFCCKDLHPFKGKRLFLTNPGRGILAMKFLRLLSCCTCHVLLKRSTPTEHVFLQFSGLSSCFSCGCFSFLLSMNVQPFDDMTSDAMGMSGLCAKLHRFNTKAAVTNINNVLIIYFYRLLSFALNPCSFFQFCIHICHFVKYYIRFLLTWN